MKKILLLITLLFVIPLTVNAKTAIDSYGNEYEIKEEAPSDFSEDDIADEYNVTNFVTTTTSVVKEEKKEENNTFKYIAYGIVALIVIVVLIGVLTFLLKALRAENLY